MPIRIQEDDAERLGDEVRKGRDPLSLGCTSVRNVRDVADALLTGDRPVPEDAKLSRIDEVGVAILAHMGIHPAAVAALAHAGNGVGLEAADGTVIGEALTDIRPDFRLDFDGLTWNGAVLSVPRLPDTVRALIPTFDDFGDMPLERIVSHPALDPLRIEIWGHGDDEKDPSRTLLDLSSMSRPQTRREMDIAWRAACGRRRAETQKRGEKP